MYMIRKSRGIGCDPVGQGPTDGARARLLGHNCLRHRGARWGSCSIVPRGRSWILLNRFAKGGGAGVHQERARGHELLKLAP